MEIRVLGSGCNNCKKLLANVQEAVKEAQMDAQVKYVTDFQEIAATGLLRTPGLIINQTIVSSGKVCSVEEVKGYLQQHRG